MTVKLYDYLGCLHHITDIPVELPKVIIWNGEAFIKQGKRAYYQAPLYVLDDTR